MSDIGDFVLGVFYLLLVVCALITGVSLVYSVGYSSGVSDIRKEAVEKHFGRYQFDEKTGKSKFIWNP